MSGGERRKRKRWGNSAKTIQYPPSYHRFFCSRTELEEERKFKYDDILMIWVGLYFLPAKKKK